MMQSPEVTIVVQRVKLTLVAPAVPIKELVLVAAPSYLIQLPVHTLAKTVKNYNGQEVICGSRPQYGPDLAFVAP